MDSIKDAKMKWDFLSDKIDRGISEVKLYTAETLAEMKQKATEAESNLAALGIILDVDRDGKVTKDEAIGAIKDLATGSVTDGNKRRLLFDPDLWVGVAGAVVTSFGAAVVTSRNRRTKAELKKLRDDSAKV